MAIPLVSANGTNQVWIGRTNQVINIVNNLTDGSLTLNGSITFSNSTFSLVLPSLNVANSIVVTGTSGNSFFLNSSNAVVNGTIYSIGTGNALYVANNALIGGNLSLVTNMTVGGTLFANNEIVGNANVQISGVDGQLRAVQGNYGVILRNDGNTFYILQTGNVSNATTASFNSMQPLSWNLSTGALTLDNSQNGVKIGGATTINNSLSVSGNTTLQGNLNINGPGIGLTVQNSANVQGSFTAGGLIYANDGIQMSNTAITFDKPGTTFIQYSPTDFAGNGALQLSGNIQVIGQMIVTGTATFTNTVTFQTSTDQSLNVVSSAAVGNNLSVVNKITAANGIFSDLHSTGRILSDGGEIVAKLGTAGQFRAINGSVGIIFRNDGTNFTLLTTGTTTTPDTSTFNTLRPITINATTGAISLDGTAAGLSTAGTFSVGIQGISSGTSMSSNAIILSNSVYLFGKDTGGTPRNLIGTDIGNFTDVFCGLAGFRVLNLSGSSALVNLDTVGNFSTAGSITSGGQIISSGALIIPNNIYCFGKNTGGVAVPLIGCDTLNNNLNWCGPGGWRIVNSTGTTELIKILNDGTTTFEGIGLISMATTLAVGGASVAGTSGTISAYNGYQAKAGTQNGFRSNVFNIDWNGSQAGIYIDSALIASFSSGTNLSDRRLKEDIKDAPSNSLSRIRKLHEVSFRLKNTELMPTLSSIEQLGYIADELQEIIPQAVNGEKNAVDINGQIIPQTINPLAIMTEITQAIDELAVNYDNLSKRIARLETMNK